MFLIVAPVTESCFPRVSSGGTRSGRCYSHRCYRYPGADRPFYTVTESGWLCYHCLTTEILKSHIPWNPNIN